jgi:purine-binding chemotaxis protein CheW
MRDSIDTASQERVQHILEARARALAKPQDAELRRGVKEVLVIRVGDERYGIAIEHVREVRSLESVTPVPGLPPLWAGLVNLRGVLYPVLDTADYLRLNPDGDKREIVLVSSPTVIVGMTADEVFGMRSLMPAEIGPPLEAKGDTENGVVSGVTADLLLLLDAEAMLRDPRLVVDEETFAGGFG